MFTRWRAKLCEYFNWGSTFAGQTKNSDFPTYTGHTLE